MTAIAQSCEIRAARMEDLDDVVRILNAFALERYGVPEYSLPSVRAEWQSDHLEIASDTRVAFDSDGRMIAFVEFWDDPNGAADDLQFYLHCAPRQVPPTLAAELIHFAERRAAAAIPRAAPDKPIDLITSAWVDNAEVRSILESTGFRPSSYNTVMHIDFESEPDPAVWPEGITVRRFRLGVDDRAVHATRQEAWADMRRGHPIPFEMWRYYLIENNEHFDESLWFMAMAGEEVAGICLCRPRTTEDPDRGWISSVGVKRAYRRRGIASAMLRHAFHELYARGIRKAGLDVDSESPTGANRIYERAGMRPVRQTVNYVKALK